MEEILLSKQQVCQKFILKIHSSRLRKARWKLNLPLSDARRNNELISLADSQVLRWIDEINGVCDADYRARQIKAEIRQIHKEENCAKNKQLLRAKYAELDKVQFKPDYMCLIIDKDKDYYRANKGFTINGIKYVRLLGTSGGIKNRTIVFVSEAVAPELRRRIDNDRDMSVAMVPAKLEAYKALACSATVPVSMPTGVLIVPSCETQFYSPVIYLDDENSDEPIMEERPNEPITLDESDGYGLMLPSLAQKWSDDLHLSYLVSGVNTRFAWEKGMVFTFDFLEFAEQIAGNYIVKDAWGHDIDIRQVELILTTSMVKLWNCYESCDDYLSKSIKNGYSFGVAKTCPEKLEKERTTNYQFIQSYKLDDNDIDELIAPTMTEIEDILGGDYLKTILFLRGCNLGDGDIVAMGDSYIKALMIEPALRNDSYIQNNVYQLIKNRINEAKVGVLNIHGNYSIISGDPYALCQSIFGLPVTGLMKAGEIYNKFWLDEGAERLACFRAPMTCHNNIQLVTVHRSEEAAYWYRYMTTCTLLNAWDTITHALNGADKDGDIVMLTDNRILIERHEHSPTVMCVQRKATKKIVTEDDIVLANISSFGDEIGKITNRITSMFEVQARFKEGSPEYRELDYRIKCGQLLQQNAIDKTKGIVAKPMPRSWYDWRSAMDVSPDRRALYTSIVADKKPYFMRYIYPRLMKDYNTYIKNSTRACLREFGQTPDELMAMPCEDLTDQQIAYIKQYRNKMPVGMGDCIMNKICRRFEQRFDSAQMRRGDLSTFDYTIMKSGAEYSKAELSKIAKLYDAYIADIKGVTVARSRSRFSADEIAKQYDEIRTRFVRECEFVCPNSETLCDILLDLCYGTGRNKKFVWSMCGGQIIQNLLNKHNGAIAYPSEDVSGKINFRGMTFSERTIYLEGESDEYSFE